MVEEKKRESIYPWDKWEGKLPEGKAWMVERFVDYQCQSRSFAGMVYKFARERGQKAVVVVIVDQTELTRTTSVLTEYVLFTFYDPNSIWKPNLPAFRDVKKMRRKLGYE